MTAIESVAEIRLVFLVGLEEGQVAFEIRPLQEFMAGEALLDGGDEAAQARLEEIASSQNWRNVFLFAAGKCFKERLHFRQNIVQICYTLNDSIKDLPSRILLAGSDLALDLLTEGAAKRSPKFAVQLTRLALRLLSSETQNRGVILADAWTLDTIYLFREAVSSLIRRGHEHEKVNAWSCWTRLADLGAITVEEWSAVVSDVPILLDTETYFWRATAATKSNEILLATLGSNLFRMSPIHTFMSADHAGLESSRTVLLANRDDLWPEGLKIASTVLRRSVMSERVSLTLPGGMLISVISCSAIREFVEFNIPQDSHPDWATLKTLSRYLSEGTADALAVLLETMATSGNRTLQQALIQRLPWPAAACLRLAADNTRLLELAAGLRAGALGDLEDWKLWESTWKSGPVNIWREIGHTTGEWPFSPQGYDLAPLLVTHAIDWSEKLGKTRSASDWHDALSAIVDASRIQRTDFRDAVLESLLVHYIYIWLIRRRAGTVPDNLDLKLFLRAHRAVLDCSGQPWLLCAALERIQLPADDEQWATYVEILNLASIRSGRAGRTIHQGQRLATTLRVDFAKDPKKIGLLRIIALNAAESGGDYGPLDVDTLARLVPSQSDPDIQAYLLILRARQGLLREEHVRQAIELLDGPARTFFSVLVRALSLGGGLEQAESLLVAAYEHLRTTDDANM
ncbi:MAG: hypothetical protein ACREQV_22980, partial [Candidatus Binatia bacterium]